MGCTLDAPRAACRAEVKTAGGPAEGENSKRSPHGVAATDRGAPKGSGRGINPGAIFNRSKYKRASASTKSNTHVKELLSPWPARAAVSLAALIKVVRPKRSHLVCGLKAQCFTGERSINERFLAVFRGK
jgi:hypothetical protein